MGAAVENPLFFFCMKSPFLLSRSGFLKYENSTLLKIFQQGYLGLF